MQRETCHGNDVHPLFRSFRALTPPDPGNSIRIVPGKLGLAEIAAIHAGGVSLALDPSVRPAMHASAAVVQRAARGDAPVYGVNTGFGKLAQTRISEEDLATLQLNLIRSH